MALHLNETCSWIQRNGFCSILLKKLFSIVFVAIVTPVDTSHSLRSWGLLSRILIWILDQLLLSLLNRSLLLLRRFFLKFRCPLPNGGLLAIWGLLKGF